MSSSTPLLPRPNHKKNDHTMFLRVCHSPHSFISQKVLRVLRGIIALYMIGALATRLYYDFSIPEIKLKGWRSPFQPSNIAWLFLTIYEIRGFVWTHMHLWYPRLQNEPNSFGKSIKTFLSPPRKSTFLNLLSFSLSYNGATVLNPLATFMHWAVVIQHKSLPVDSPDLPKFPVNVPNDVSKLPGGQYETWVMVNFYIINTVIALVEAFFFSSIRCDQVSYFPQVPGTGLNHWQPIFIHFVWGFVTGLLLIGWLYLGHYLTGEYMYFFLDLDAYDWTKVVVMIIAFITLIEVLYLLNHFIIVFRQSITAKQSKRRTPRLPQ